MKIDQLIDAWYHWNQGSANLKQVETQTLLNELPIIMPIINSQTYPSSNKWWEQLKKIMIHTNKDKF